MAVRFGAGVSDWSELPGALACADIVIASTGAQRPVLTLEMLKQVQRARRGRPLFLLDIAVPRDVEPEVGTLDGIYLADIDDLQKVAAEHRDGRKNEAAEAEAIVAQELARFLKAWRGRQLAPTVTALRAHVLGVAQAEAARVVAAIPGLGERERRAIAELGRGDRQEAAARAADGAAQRRRRRRRLAGGGGAAAVRAGGRRRRRGRGRSIGGGAAPTSVDKKAAGR